MASHCCQSDMFSGQRTIALKTREVQPGVRCSSSASASRCRAVARFRTLVRAVPAFISAPWNQSRECSRCKAERMCPLFCRSSQTISVGRCWRRRRPRIRWPVPRASIATPLRSTIRLSRQTSPRPTAAGKSAASRGLSSSSALRFSRWARPGAWCRRRSRCTIPSLPGRRGAAGRGCRWFAAPPRGPSTFLICCQYHHAVVQCVPVGENPQKIARDTTDRAMASVHLFTRFSNPDQARGGASGDKSSRRRSGLGGTSTPSPNHTIRLECRHCGGDRRKREGCLIPCRGGGGDGQAG